MKENNDVSRHRCDPRNKRKAVGRMLKSEEPADGAAGQQEAVLLSSQTEQKPWGNRLVWNLRGIQVGTKPVSVKRCEQKF